MKKIIFIVAIAGLIFSSCGNKKKKTEDNVGYHTHEDGTVYRDDAHNHDNDTKPVQESFEVETDEDTEHKHEGGDHDSDGHEHDHEHGEHN